MEDIKTLLEQTDYHLKSSSDENESEDESLATWDLGKRRDDGFSLASTNPVLESKSSNSVTLKKRNGEKRLPTRRPDPNVYNRNALLARENRRKKKMYLETIEKELQFARKANRTLLKALKRQLKISQKLEEEKKYFERLITNRPEVLSLVKAFNFDNSSKSESNKSPFSTSSNNDYTYSSMGDVLDTASSSSSCNGSEQFLQFDTPSDDLENTNVNVLPNSTTWDDIWSDTGYHIDNLILPESPKRIKNGLEIVNDDHSYIAATALTSKDAFAQKNLSREYIDVEIFCSHIGSGKKSDVICPICNWNPDSPTPPLQLLNDQSSQV